MRVYEWTENWKAFLILATTSSILYKLYTSYQPKVSEKMIHETTNIDVSIQQTFKGTETSHHRFVNPWPSFKEHGLKDAVRMVNLDLRHSCDIFLSNFSSLQPCRCLSFNPRHQLKVIGKFLYCTVKKRIDSMMVMDRATCSCEATRF